MIDASVSGDDWVLWVELWTRALRDERVREARQRLDDRSRPQIASIIRRGEAGEFVEPTRIASRSSSRR